MKRPPWEVADLIRKSGRRFIDRFEKYLSWPQVKVLNAIERCRTAALGGHRDQCDRCGHQAISYHSCRNRHCPKCQTNARDEWLATRQQELLPVDYYHLVFSVPHTLVPLVWQNKKVLFKLLFEASAEALLEVAADPKHIGAEIGFLSVPHTWGQTLQPHPHIHCVVPGGGLSPDHQHWISAPNHFFLPVRVLSRVFRGKFVAGLQRAFRQDKLRLLRNLRITGSAEGVFCFPANAIRRRLGRVRQKTLRRSGTRASLSGPLHTSRRNLEPSHCRHDRCSADIPLERLCPPQQAPHDDTDA